jgi:hypothetical protein
MPARSNTGSTAPNGRAPDAPVTLADGSSTRLSRLWQDATLVLVFLRHFG